MARVPCGAVWLGLAEVSGAPARQTNWQRSFVPQNAWRFSLEEHGPSQSAESFEPTRTSRILLGPPADVEPSGAARRLQKLQEDLIVAREAHLDTHQEVYQEPRQLDAETVSVSDSSKDVLARLLRQLRDLREETRLLTECRVKEEWRLLLSSNHQ